MKALSIRQPWAWLICAGYKNIENRTWSTKFRGRIYVHTGKKPDIDGWQHLEECYENYPNGTEWIDVFQTTPQKLLDICGCIIGEVDIVDYVTESKSPWFIGRYGFVLANPVLYDKPIPCMGKLGFFEPKIEGVV